MKSDNLVLAVIGAILKVIFTVVIIYVIYRGAAICYDYGYRVFTEPAVSSGEGRTITVTIKKGTTATEMGEFFEKKGLIREANLFVLQYYLSEFREDIQPGTFELSTAMTAEEMMEVMATPQEEVEKAK